MSRAIKKLEGFPEHIIDLALKNQKKTYGKENLEYLQDFGLQNHSYEVRFDNSIEGLKFWLKIKKGEFDTPIPIPFQLPDVKVVVRNYGLENFVEQKQIHTSVIYLWAEQNNLDIPKKNKKGEYCFDSLVQKNWNKFHSWVDKMLVNGKISGTPETLHVPTIIKRGW